MKKIKSIAITCIIAVATISCQTTYDAYGNPRQTVDPGTAAAGAAAAGIIGYSLAKDRDKNKNYYHQPRVGDRRYGYYDRFGRWNWYR